MLLAMTIMYIASGVHWSFNLYTFMREMQDPVAWLALPNETVYRWSLVTTVALFFDVSICKQKLCPTDNEGEVLDQRYGCDVARCIGVGVEPVGHSAVHCTFRCPGTSICIYISYLMT